MSGTPSDGDRPDGQSVTITNSDGTVTVEDASLYGGDPADLNQGISRAELNAQQQAAEADQGDQGTPGTPGTPGTTTPTEPTSTQPSNPTEPPATEPQTSQPVQQAAQENADAQAQIQAENQAKFGDNAKSPTMGSVVVEDEDTGSVLGQVKGLKGTNKFGLNSHAEAQGKGFSVNRLGRLARAGYSGNVRVTIISGNPWCPGCAGRLGMYAGAIQGAAGPNINVSTTFLWYQSATAWGMKAF